MNRRTSRPSRFFISLEVQIVDNDYVPVNLVRVFWAEPLQHQGGRCLIDRLPVDHAGIINQHYNVIPKSYRVQAFTLDRFHDLTDRGLLRLNGFSSINSNNFVGSLSYHLTLPPPPLEPRLLSEYSWLITRACARSRAP